MCVCLFPHLSITSLRQTVYPCSVGFAEYDWCLELISEETVEKYANLLILAREKDSFWVFFGA